MKERILEIIKTKPKHFTRLIKKDAELDAWVISNSTIDADSPYIEHIYSALNPSVNPICENGNKKKFKSIFDGYRQFCGTGKQCPCRCCAQSKNITNWHNSLSDADRSKMQQKSIASNRKKYGVDNVMQSDNIKQKIRKKHSGIGFENSANLSKARETFKKSTGYDSPLHSPLIQKKITKTHMEKYGGLMVHARSAAYKKYDGNPFAHPDVKKQIQKKHQEKYGVTSYKQAHYTEEQKNVLFNKENFVAYVNGKGLKEIQHELGVDSKTIARYASHYDCRHLIKSISRSRLELKMKDLLDELKVNYVQNTKAIISPMELDFYLPDYNVAIEVGSLFWHSEIAGKRSKRYHYDKWLACKEKNIDLYQYFDDDIDTKWNVIEAKIKYITSTSNLPVIGARNLTVRAITDMSIEVEFLSNYHIQGRQGARTKTYGAYDVDGILRGVLSVHVKDNTMEITRFATDLNASYPGLFSKLLKHAITELKFTGTVFSFSDNAHSNGKVYKSAGFRLDKILPPSYYYTYDYHTRINRQHFMKNKIAKKFNVDVKDKSEWQLMQELGYDRIWDCGKIKWIKQV